MPSAEQTQKWNEEKGIDALSRSIDKPSMEYCEDQNGTIISTRVVDGHSHGDTINPTLCCDRHTVELDRTHNPRGQLFQL